MASSQLSEFTDPWFAIDGNYEAIFHSQEGEYNPWLQMHLSNITLVETVTIVTRLEGPYDFEYGDFKDVEIRAGKMSLDLAFQGRIAVNDICGNYLGPGVNSAIYTIKCSPAIESDYITIQLMGNEPATLQLTEVLVNEFKETGRIFIHELNLKIFLVIKVFNICIQFI